MGGISRGTLTGQSVQGREAVRMRGTVSLENNGGFIQVAANIPSGSGSAAGLLDASAFTGIELTATGNGEIYNIHLRTADITRPWQSYRQSFIAGPVWQTHTIPFSDFVPYRIDTTLDITKLRRIGIVAIGRAFEADVSVSEVRLY